MGLFMPLSNENLIRRQFFISRSNDEKLKSIAKGQGMSKADVLRNAIDAYAPNSDEAVLSELVRQVNQSNAETNKMLDDSLALSRSIVGRLLKQRQGA